MNILYFSVNIIDTQSRGAYVVLQKILACSLNLSYPKMEQYNIIFGMLVCDEDNDPTT